MSRVVAAGWWDAHVAPHLNPVEVVAQVERLKPDHPALPRLRLRKIAEAYTRVAGKPLEPRLYRCSVCRDSGVVPLVVGTRYKTFGASEVGGKEAAGWAPDERAKHVETKTVRPGQHVVTRCKGPKGEGCAWDAWRKEQKAPAAREPGEAGAL